MNEDTDSLEGVLADIMARLTNAARDRHSAMHTPVLGTADGDMRIAVLRACDPDLAALRFHTDARSPKIAAIEADAAVSLLAYDPVSKVQIRAAGTARIERAGPVADAAWGGASTFARRCYMIEAAPGTPIAVPGSGLPEWIEGKNPSEEQLAPARENFAVILLRLDRLDWLHLAHTGHRRARFIRDEAGAAWQGAWLVP